MRISLEMGRPGKEPADLDSFWPRVETLHFFFPFLVRYSHGCANWVRYWGSIRRLVTSVVYCQIFFICPKILNTSFPLLACFTTFGFEDTKTCILHQMFAGAPTASGNRGPHEGWRSRWSRDSSTLSCTNFWKCFEMFCDMFWRNLGNSWEYILQELSWTGLNWVELVELGGFGEIRCGEGSSAEPRELPMPCQFQRLHQDWGTRGTWEQGGRDTRDTRDTELVPCRWCRTVSECAGQKSGSEQYPGCPGFPCSFCFWATSLTGDRGRFMAVKEEPMDLLGTLFKVLRDFKTYCVLLWDSGLQACQWACRLCTWHYPVTLPRKGRSLQFAGCHEKA